MDARLPGAWSNKRLLGFAVLGQLMMVMVATRHAFIYGGSFHVLLNVLESLGLIAATLVACSLRAFNYFCIIFCRSC